MQRIRGDKVDVLAWAEPAQIESVALDQLRNIAKLPWVFHHVAAMPDVHFGKGATVGSVIAMKGAVSPAAVGVDIGCGMAAVRTSLAASDLPDSLGGLRSEIERAIPVGFEQHRRPVQSDPELWRDFQGLTPAVRDLESKARHQLGTLGGGNHFLELCLDTEERVWLMLHSGSRNIGKTLAEIHIGRAKKLAHNQGLPDRDLAVFLAGTREMQEYRRDLFWAQRYARANREAMLDLYQDVLRRFRPLPRVAHRGCNRPGVGRQLLGGIGRGRGCDPGLPSRDLHPLQLLASLVVAPVEREQRREQALRLFEAVLPFGDVGQGLESDHVLAVKGEHVRERRFGRREVAQVEVAATEHDAGGDVVGMERQAGPQQLERTRHVAVLAVALRKRSEGQALGILSVPTLELLYFAKCHRGPLVEVRAGVEGTCWSLQGSRESSEPR